MARRTWRLRAAAVVLIASTAACNTPATARGTQADGRRRVLALLDETRRALPAGPPYSFTRATGTVPCRRTLLGYAVGTTGAQRIEAPLIVPLSGDTRRWTVTHDGPRLARHSLDGVAALWRARGYDVDRSGLGDARFPKVTARVDGYEAVATGWADTPQVTLYARSPCLGR